MLYRKISNLIENHLASRTNSILLIYGARQIGKTFIIREVGKKLFKNFIEINMIEDTNGPGLFKNVTTVDDFLLQYRRNISSNYCFTKTRRAFYHTRNF